MSPKKRTEARGWKRALSGSYVPPDAPSIGVGLRTGRPQGSGAGPSRTALQQGTAAAAAARRDGSEGGSAGDDDDDDDMIDEASNQRSEHYRKCKAQQAGWKGLMPGLRGMFYASLSANMSRAQQQAAALREALQAEVDESWSAHACSIGPIYPSAFSRQPDGDVTYYGLDSIFTLNLPKWTCACCTQSFSPHAIAFGCFPSTPRTPHVWYDLRVLHLYKKFGPGEGLSATGGWMGVCLRGG